MSTITVNAKDFGAVFRQRESARLRGALAAVREAAMLGAEVVAQAIPVDVGSLKASVHVERTPTGAELVVDAPHAAALEFGARPHTPPLQPLIDWVQRHRAALGLSTRRKRDSQGRFAVAAEVVQMARKIQQKIAREGSKPHWYMRNALPKLREIVAEVIARRSGG